MATAQTLPPTDPLVNRVEDELAVDETVSDSGENYDSDLTSLSSSIYDYVYENGRRYHALNAGSYLLPNDEKEQERLDLMHHLLTMVLGGELHAVKLPPNVRRILDIGTGTGVWALDMAEQHPDALVYGADLSPIQPTFVPSNCFFEVADITEPWKWEHAFDFIHSRNMGQGVKDWAEYTRRIYDNLTPGGVVQLVEVETTWISDDNTIPPGGYVERHQQAYDRAAELAGISDKGRNLEGHLRDAGFEDVRVVVKKSPIGPWAKGKAAKELGMWERASTEAGLEPYSLTLFTRYLGMEAEEVREMCRGAMTEMRTKGVHVYHAYWFVEGRKPEA